MSLETSRIRVPFAPDAFNLLLERLAEVRDNAAARAVATTGELSLNAIDRALREIAETGELIKYESAPSLPSDLHFWIDRRLFPLRSRVSDFAIEKAKQSSPEGARVTAQYMKWAWEYIWNDTSRRLSVILRPSVATAC